MRIVREKVDNEHYLELCISPKEFKLLNDYMIVSRQFQIDGLITNVGIKLEIDEEEYDFDCYQDM